ncbi:MAG: hypothetical protein QM528_06960 [Phycisphaerales bacterium]|nr:hypothetical protein [Phycisphaerales bacterium]
MKNTILNSSFRKSQLSNTRGGVGTRNKFGVQEKGRVANNDDLENLRVLWI